MCKDCHKEYRKAHYEANKPKYLAKARKWESENGGPTKVRYNLSDAVVSDLKAIYDGKCWICRIKEAVHIDHDHTCCPTQRSCGNCVRGMLCSGCNTGLGMLGDSIESLGTAIDYLKMYGS